ncbi:MAG: amino acid ABC transporter permease [Kaiparowitsia implicata GSE-PSE-MK54-09C]|jgi:His/Glu/Gln/Arg/opine family amino acid ABC transporter permease subunit|nr:amino acid ABC transporter permease [Kaiparowitsia implicata GSE-PSE-MK54-09C]
MSDDWLYNVSITPLSVLAQGAGLVLDFSRIRENIPFILQGVPVTLSFSIVSALFGFTWGTVLSIFKISNILPLKLLADLYTSIFRGTPLILQLALIYFATPQLTGITPTPFQAAVVTFSLNSAAYSSETIRGGIMAVDRGQREAAMTLGVKYPTMMWDIVLPQAFKNILPALVNESIALLKDSALVSTVGALDLMRRGQVVAAEKFIFFEPLMIVAVIYYVLVMGLTFVAQQLERRMRKSD